MSFHVPVVKKIMNPAAVALSLFRESQNSDIVTIQCDT